MLRLSLAELAALQEEYLARQKREDWRTAMIICALVNVHRSKEDGALQPADVMPWLREEEKPEAQRQKSPQEIREMFENLTREMGGIVHPRNQPLASG